MIGELIQSAYTYNQGRVAINNAFSAQTSFNQFSAETIYSGSTNLGDIIASITGNTTIDEFQELNYFSAGNVFWDTSTGKNKTLTLTADTILQIANTSNGDFGTLKVRQDGVGGQALLLSGTNKVINGGGGAITVSSSPNAEDILSFVDIGGVKYWNAGYNYS